MSYFAGILFLNNRLNKEDSNIQCLKRSLSGLNQYSIIDSGNRERLLLFYTAMSGYGDAGFYEKDNNVLVVSGHPHYYPSHNSSKYQDRSTNCRELLEDFLNAPFEDVIRKCRGSFSLFSFNYNKKCGFLATDVIGVRPVYFVAGEKYFIFSTKLSVIVNSNIFPWVVSAEALVEKISFGFCLGDRTPYQQIKVLRGGSVVKINKSVIHSSQYCRLEDFIDNRSVDGNYLSELHEVFLKCLEVRCGDTPDAYSLLSGGLDSRVVVGGLFELGKQVKAINFGRRNTQDREYAIAVAKELGIKIQVEELPFSFANQHFGKIVSKAFSRLLFAQGISQINAPIFSGDGGSVSLGHVYITPTQVEQARINNDNFFIQNILDQSNRLPLKIFDKNFVKMTENACNNGILNELKSIDKSIDPGRKLYLFLMQNDQRCHLHDFYEDEDRCDIEYALPFFDIEFIKKILSAKIDGFLYHRAYVDWLSYFPANISRVPWQSYKDHVPCPLADDKDYRSQFEQQNKWIRSLKAIYPDGFSMLKKLFLAANPPFINRERAAAAFIANILLVRDYRYIFRAVLTSQYYCQSYPIKYFSSTDNQGT